MDQRHPPRWPTWLVVVGGAVLTVGVIVWLGATYDSHGNPLLDDTVAKLLIGLAGSGLTTVVALGTRKLGRIEHEVKPNHGSSMADAVNRIEIKLARLASVPAEIAGLRRDVGRQATTDQQTHEDVAQLRREFTTHVEWAQKQQARIDGLEDTRKKES